MITKHIDAATLMFAFLVQEASQIPRIRLSRLAMHLKEKVIYFCLCKKSFEISVCLDAAQGKTQFMDAFMRPTHHDVLISTGQPDKVYYAYAFVGIDFPDVIYVIDDADK